MVIPFDETLAHLKDKFLEAKELKATAAKLEKDAGVELILALGDSPIVCTTGATITYKVVSSSRWDTKALDAEGPEFSQKYKKVSSYRKLNVKQSEGSTNETI